MMNKVKPKKIVKVNLFKGDDGLIMLFQSKWNLKYCKCVRPITCPNCDVALKGKDNLYCNYCDWSWNGPDLSDYNLFFVSWADGYMIRIYKCTECNYQFMLLDEDYDGELLSTFIVDRFSSECCYVKGIKYRVTMCAYQGFPLHVIEERKAIPVRPDFDGLQKYDIMINSTEVCK